MWRVVRFLFRLFAKLSFWQQGVMVACAPVLALNLTVATLGHSAIFPLSPFFLKQKWAALELYAKHRPWCLLTGHGDLDELIDRAERKYALPVGLMHAIVTVESGNHVHRISFAGAVGPAQLMPATATLLGVSDPFDPAQSIDAGARYLAAQLKRTGRVDLAVAAYNAGPGAVNGAVPHNGETEIYVARVMKALRR